MRAGLFFFFFYKKRKRTFHRLSLLSSIQSARRSLYLYSRIDIVDLGAALCVWLSSLSMIYHISYTPRLLSLCVVEHLSIWSSIFALGKGQSRTSARARYFHVAPSLHLHLSQPRKSRTHTSRCCITFSTRACPAMSRTDSGTEHLI